MDAEKVSVIIADSHEIVREAIAARLSSALGAEIVAECSDGYATLKACRQSYADFLIMDLALSRPTGAEILPKLRKSVPHLKIIVVSSEATVSNAFFALSQGAIGFMPKQAKGDDFVQAVNAANNGYAYTPIEFIQDFVNSKRNINRKGNAYGLSQREIEILESCISGKTAKEVAHDLGISVRTVETHRNNIYKKTQCRSQQELSTLASGMI